MDPNANLTEQLDLARIINRGGEIESIDFGYRLAEFVLALDDWLSKGGSLPERWRKPCQRDHDQTK